MVRSLSCVFPLDVLIFFSFLKVQIGLQEFNVVLPKEGNSLDAKRHTLPINRSMIEGTPWDLAGG